MTHYPTAPVMVWDLAGRPHRPTLGVTEMPGVCAMCGQSVLRTAPAKKWLEGKSFTDPAHLRARSGRVCEACAWTVTGKGMDQIRMWTILARTDRALPPSNPKAAFATRHVHFTTRADMRAVVDTLADPPTGQWVVAVAESGQKHVLPYTRINHGPGRWRIRMDALDIDATPAEFRTVFAHTCALRAAGHTTEEIKHLTPAYSRLTTIEDLTLWQQHATALTPWRSAPLLHLATFLINKEHLDAHTHTYPTGTPDAGAAGLDRPGGPVPRRDDVERGRRHDRPHSLVGPGPHRAGDRGRDGDTLF